MPVPARSSILIPNGINPGRRLAGVESSVLCGERWPGRLGERRQAQDALEVSGSYRQPVPWAVACISWVAVGRLCHPHRGLPRSPAALAGAVSAGRRTRGSDVAAAAPSLPPSAAAVASAPSRRADGSGTGTPPGSAPLRTVRGHDRSPPRNSSGSPRSCSANTGPGSPPRFFHAINTTPSRFPSLSLTTACACVTSWCCCPLEAETGAGIFLRPAVESVRFKRRSEMSAPILRGA